MLCSTDGHSLHLERQQSEELAFSGAVLGAVADEVPLKRVWAVVGVAVVALAAATVALQSLGFAPAGCLIARSGYLPKLLGILMGIAGLGYLLDSFLLILSPALHAMIFPASLLPAFVAETSFCLWLLLKGVDVEKWKLQASSQPT